MQEFEIESFGICTAKNYRNYSDNEISKKNKQRRLFDAPSSSTFGYGSCRGNSFCH